MQEYGVEVPQVHVAYERCFQRMAEKMRVRARDANSMAAATNTSTVGTTGFAVSDGYLGPEQGVDGVRATAMDGVERSVANSAGKWT